MVDRQMQCSRWSALGPLVLSGLLLVFVRNKMAPSDDYRWLLVLAALVLVIRIAIVQFGITEQKNIARDRVATRAPLAKSF